MNVVASQVFETSVPSGRVPETDPAASDFAGVLRSRLGTAGRDGGTTRDADAREARQATGADRARADRADASDADRADSLADEETAASLDAQAGVDATSDEQPATERTAGAEQPQTDAAADRAAGRQEPADPALISAGPAPETILQGLEGEGAVPPRAPGLPSSEAGPAGPAGPTAAAQAAGEARAAASAGAARTEGASDTIRSSGSEERARSAAETASAPRTPTPGEMARDVSSAVGAATDSDHRTRTDGAAVTAARVASEEDTASTAPRAASAEAAVQARASLDSDSDATRNAERSGIPAPPRIETANGHGQSRDGSSGAIRPEIAAAASEEAGARRDADRDDSGTGRRQDPRVQELASAAAIDSVERLAAGTTGDAGRLASSAIDTATAAQAASGPGAANQSMPTAASASAAPPPPSGAASPPPAGEAVAVQTEWLASRGGGSARLVLHPPELGEIAIRVTLRGGAVDVVMVAQEVAAQAVAEDQGERLAQAFASRDLRMEHFEVRRADGSVDGEAGPDAQLADSDAREHAGLGRDQDQAGQRGGALPSGDGIRTDPTSMAGGPQLVSTPRERNVDLRI